MDDLFIKPEEMLAEAEAYSSAADTVSQNTCTPTFLVTHMESADSLKRALEQFQALVQTFVEQSRKDANCLRVMRADWMQLDETVAKEIAGGELGKGE